MSLCVKVAIHTTGPVTAAFFNKPSDALYQTVVTYTVTTGPVTAAFFNKPSDALYQTVVTYTVAVASILCCCF